MNTDLTLFCMEFACYPMISSHSPKTFMSRSIGDSKLPLGLCVRMNGVCAGPVMDTRPVQGLFPAFFAPHVLGDAPADRCQTC